MHPMLHCSSAWIGVRVCETCKPLRATCQADAASLYHFSKEPFFFFFFFFFLKKRRHLAQDKTFAIQLLIYNFCADCTIDRDASFW